MYSLKPTLDNFKVNIPRKFLFQNVIDTFTPLIMGDVKSPFVDIYDYLEESIKNFTMPSKNFEPTSILSPTMVDDRNNLVNSINFQRSNISIKDIIDTTFDLTFRLNDGYLNYFLMDYQFIEAFKHTTKDIYLHDFVVEIFKKDGVKLFELVYKKVIYNGITGFELGYDNTESEIVVFTCTFTHNGYEIKLPKLI